MKRQPHSDRLRRFSDIIQPIAESLNSNISSVSEPSAASVLPRGDIANSKRPQDNIQSSEDYGFFSSLQHFEEASTQPMGLPPGAAHADGKPPGRLFEYLRQSVLQRSAKEFTKLPLRLQAIARMGGLIYTERLNFQPRIYHLLANGVLLGVLDRRKGRFFMRRRIAPIDLTDLHCVIRPHHDEKISAEMELMPVQDAVWLYGMHDPEALLDLPAEMGTHWLHLRKLPSISPHLLVDRHMALIRLLLVREHLFDQLLRSTPKHNHTHLLRDLASMLLTRSIEALPAGFKHAGRLKN
jgi:hypothetical protein